MPSFKLRDAETGQLVETPPAPATMLPQAEAFRPGSSASLDFSNSPNPETPTSQYLPHPLDPLDPVAPPLLLARADDPASHQEPLFYLFLDLPSFGVLGWAAVTDVDPHPRIRPAPSPQTRPPARLVTGRFESIARELLDVTIATDRGETDVIQTTPSHPFYSADRRDHIPAAQLRLDERLRTADDPPGHASARVKSLVPRASPWVLYAIRRYDSCGAINRQTDQTVRCHKFLHAPSPSLSAIAGRGQCDLAQHRLPGCRHEACRARHGQP